MSSSDDSDSSIIVSDESDIESIISESEGDEEAGFDEIDDQFSDSDDGNQVSGSVFPEGTESALNLMFFAGGSIAGAIAQTFDTNRTTDQPMVQAAGVSSLLVCLFDEPYLILLPETENDMDSVDLGSDDISTEVHANISHTQTDAFPNTRNSSVANTTAPYTNKASNAVRALEAKIARDIGRNHLSMPLPGQTYGTKSNTTTRLVQVPHNPGFLECLGWRLRRTFLQPNIYTPLPSPSHIRVLFIQPGVNEDTLVASFELLDLNAANIRFEAISYQWSECGGQKASMRLGGEQMSINAYLRNILLHLRREQHIRVMWADALCINQSDHAERLQQVSIMQKIYSQAFRVIGFVGKDYTHAGMCFNAIKALTSAWFEVRKSFGQDDSTFNTW
ncbi:hypothetical protein FOXG_13317 [Fusarium oxysporum f. sp. lycopersici 4287]|uniref:Heterokaryon incompatibility domain-containing protein n=2 Tax=Fusarium oxysporum TaxID=5507 RepID=A0A0J9VUP6_FUSO4|nr:hypothetical protein FOXG_13317 [Fusarium oxysporum f. sp. lycopersici 4287]EXK36392.1 hypothetical protein FOMG_09567 [Fusarium oxysporum f. sp. melonis 26406]KNB14461.1 hypothetical protein FOXG_13317 [Fusarium oxysporum f. sp. lycopersici 4287]